MSHRHADELLRERARAFAAPVTVTVEETPTAALVVGLDDGTTCAMEVSFVQQVYDDMSLCRLPAGSGSLLAVTVVGGVAVPVADLVSVLGSEPPRHDRPFLVLLGGPSPLGLLVNDVVGLTAVRRSDLRPLPAVPGEFDANLYRGLLPDDVPLLDVEVLLEDSRLMVLRPPHAPSAVPAPSQSGAP